MKQEPEFSVVDNRAFVNYLMVIDANWGQIFHVSEKQRHTLASKQDITELKKRKEKLKKFEMPKRQQDSANWYELETDVSNGLKIVNQFENKTEESIRPTELPKDQHKGSPKMIKIGL